MGNTSLPQALELFLQPLTKWQECVPTFTPQSREPTDALQRGGTVLPWALWGSSSLAEDLLNVSVPEASPFSLSLHWLLFQAGFCHWVCVNLQPSLFLTYPMVVSTQLFDISSPKCWLTILPPAQPFAHLPRYLNPTDEHGFFAVHHSLPPFISKCFEGFTCSHHKF